MINLEKTITNRILNTLLLYGTFLCSLSVNSQEIIHKNDTIPQYLGSPITVVDKDFQRLYKRYKPIVLKVYPYALQSADLIDQMNNDLESIKKRRKRTKLIKQSYKQLRTDYKYVFLDMYVSEGKILTKLIARETGMSIHQIIKQYKGKKDAAMFNLMGKMFDQDIKAPYVSKKEYVLEAIIRDIESGKIEFNDTLITIDKTAFKNKKVESKKRKKLNAKQSKKRKKEHKERTKINKANAKTKKKKAAKSSKTIKPID
jgi:hypothetical protein